MVRLSVLQQRNTICKYFNSIMVRLRTEEHSKDTQKYQKNNPILNIFFKIGFRNLS